MMPMPSVPTESRLVSPEDATLPLRGAALRCDARGGLARVVLEQRFANALNQPLHVTYKLPLPADAAVSGFRFRVGDRVIEGEIDRKAKARERFQEAIARGHTAALLEEERSSLFTQEIGNVPPGAEVVCEIVIDQKLRWLESRGAQRSETTRGGVGGAAPDRDEGQWEWRFPLAAAPRYLGAPGRVADAANVSLDVAESLPVRASLAMVVRDTTASGRSPESPSHPLSCAPEGGGHRVELGSGNAVPLDRDVVVRWSVATMKVGASVDVAGPRDGRLTDAHALVTVVPPVAAANARLVPRDITFLLDTSGSMSGAPLEQLKRVTLALLDGLSDHDGFEIIEFSNSPRRFEPSLSGRRAASTSALSPYESIAGTRENKRTAEKWVRKLRASGGTEMRSGILEALRPLRPGCPRQVVLITDGQIGFEQEIISEILGLLPGDARLHTVGVGSGVNRSLTMPAARAGRGVEVIIGLGEDPERAAARLRARSDAPIVVDVTVSGSALVEAAPAKVPDLFAGAPVLVSARVKPQGGEIVLRGRTAEGPWEERVAVPATSSGSGSDAVISLFGREAVEDAETRLAGGSNKRETDARIEQLGLSYRIATRLTSWIAVDHEPSVDPRDPARHERVPQQLPYGMAIEGLGLREERESYAMRSMAMPQQASVARSRAMPPAPMAAPAPPPTPRELADLGESDESMDQLEAEEEARAAAPPARGSFLGPRGPSGENRAKDAIFGRRDEEPAKKEHAAAKPKARLEGLAALVGRIVLAKGRELVVEIVLPAALDWNALAAGPRPVMTFASGASIAGNVDPTRTTREGTFTAGTTLRLVVFLDRDPGDDTPATVSLQLPGGWTMISIDL